MQCIYKSCVIPPPNLYIFYKLRLFKWYANLYTVLTFASAIILYIKWEKTSNKKHSYVSLYILMCLQLCVFTIPSWGCHLSSASFYLWWKDSLYFLQSCWQFFYYFCFPRNILICPSFLMDSFFEYSILVWPSFV